MKRWLGLLLLTAVSGCTTYEGYGYRDDGYYDDRYYDGPGYYRGSPRNDYHGYGYGYGYGYGVNVSNTCADSAHAPSCTPVNACLSPYF